MTCHSLLNKKWLVLANCSGIRGISTLFKRKVNQLDATRLVHFFFNITF